MKPTKRQQRIVEHFVKRVLNESNVQKIPINVELMVSDKGGNLKYSNGELKALLIKHINLALSEFHEDETPYIMLGDFDEDFITFDIKIK